jgi:NAD(P)-dependent dehydrogenase (short-subunit alcohol dehydrogenase family)
MGSKKNIIVFGGTSNLAKVFIEKALENHEVWATFRVKNKIYLSEKITWLPYDARFPLEGLPTTEQYFDVIINFIGSRHEDSVRNPTRFDISIDDNVRSLVHISSRLPDILKRGGSFLNISSIASYHASEREFSYGLSKSTGNSVIDYLQRFYFRKYRITNVIPGAIKTEMVAGREGYNKFIEPGEISELLLFLIESSSSFTVPEIKVFRST